jgi:formyltetrahydrofolate-dependent phosphoribosylglycinamide formyltransferase
MVSGNGSNLQAVLDACADGRIDGDVVAVVSNRPDVFALQRADAAGVPAVHIGLHPGEERAEYDARLADVIAGFEPDLIVLAGWMRVLTMSFLGWFPRQVVNLHPALPGELPGTRSIERAWDEALAGSRTSTGVMVHLVPDDGIDDGPVLATVTLDIDSTSSLAEFEAAVHAAEHRLLVRVLGDVCADPSIIDDAIGRVDTMEARPIETEIHA